MKNFYALTFLLLAMTAGAIAQPGKDGVETVSTTGVIFNRYAALAASATQGAIYITVNDINNLSASAIAGAANNPYQANGLSRGDLLMIIKMQGASIDITNTAVYGNITNYNGTGKFELVSVELVTGNNVYLMAGLNNTYTVSSTQRVQVVRIPRIMSLTVNAGASITAPSWGNSYTGGIVAIETAIDAVVNGAITVSGLGFRGGQLENDAVIGGYTGFTSNLAGHGAEKGESIAGYQADYDAMGGRYGRGAPANGGGGGNAHNAGGGGGANAGAVASWTGMGVPDISNANWITAWNLESAGFANSSSPGGGRGGYSYSRNNRDALTLAPGGSLWAGDDRKNIGGYGGRPLTYDPGATLFFGGGGGAGDQNALSGSAGGNGGGIVFMLAAGNLGGTGNITADGSTAGNSSALHTDGMGGGGAGGSILLNISGSVTGISAFARGGNGGNQLAGAGNEAEGPGGGGGGGYIAITGSPAITTSSAGGVNGTTASTGLTEFIPNGATRAGAGTATTGLTYDIPPVYSSPLAAKLLSFSANSTAQKEVLLQWSAVNEEGETYHVQKSNDQQQWQTLASKTALTNSTISKYSVSSIKLTTDTYFRIKIIAPGGAVSYSNIVLVKAIFVADTYIFTTGDQLTITNLPASAKSISIFSNNGQLICRGQLNNHMSQTISVGSLPKGLYNVIIDGSTGNRTLRFAR
jgi:hypothetical protein